MVKNSIKGLINEVVRQGRKTLYEPEAKAILKASSIPVPRSIVISDATEAAKAADSIGYPLVVKAISEDMTHKSEHGAVRLGLMNSSEVEAVLPEMFLSMADIAPSAKVSGFLIEKMVGRGLEVIVGAVRDEQFGPAVMFGVGGVAVEILKDVTFRLAPIDIDEALDMIREIKGSRLLTGFRGGEPKDVNAVADVIVRVGIIMKETEALKSFEINPLLVFENGVMAVDAKAVLV